MRRTKAAVNINFDSFQNGSRILLRLRRGSLAQAAIGEARQHQGTTYDAALQKTKQSKAKTYQQKVFEIAS
jgi:hypothetical protein